MHVEHPPHAQAVGLENVIFNIELASDYYQKTPLTYAIGHLHALYKVLTDNGVEMAIQ